MTTMAIDKQIYVGVTRVSISLTSLSVCDSQEITQIEGFL